MEFLKKNHKGQGTTEYIVILAVIVLLIVAFWGKIKPVLQGRIDSTAQEIKDVGNKD
jgi:Flp pilus assembly pilin Flp